MIIFVFQIIDTYEIMTFNSIHFVACCPNNRNNPIFVLAPATKWNAKKIWKKNTKTIVSFIVSHRVALFSCVHSSENTLSKYSIVSGIDITFPLPWFTRKSIWKGNLCYSSEPLTSVQLCVSIHPRDR